MVGMISASFGVGFNRMGQTSRSWVGPQSLTNRPQLVVDTLRFGGQKEQFTKYGIDVKQVKVEGIDEKTLRPSEKRRLIADCIAVYEHAAKKRLLNEAWLKVNPKATNVSGRSFSSMVEMNNGVRATAVNSEFTRDDILCGERSAIVSGINQAIGKLDLGKLQQDPAYVSSARNGMTVKRIIMSGAHRHKGDNPTDMSKDSISSPPPCSDCQAWMATDEYFTKDTQIVTLERTPQVGWSLKFLPVGKMLPFWGDQSVSKVTRPDTPIGKLPLFISPKAIDQIDSLLSTSKVYELMEAAQKACEGNPFAEVSKKNGAVAVMMAPTGDIVTSGRFDITARWYNEPAKSALEKGYRTLHEKGITTDPTKGSLARAFAFYGDFSQPTVSTLGHLSQLERGDGAGKTLIIRIENNQIHVRTILEMLPEVYMSARIPREGK